MLKIWGRDTSINVQRVMWAVGELGLDHERIDVGGAFGGLDTPDYGAMNPNRLVPTLEDGDLVLWESNAIVRYLARKYGEGRLAPSDEAAFARCDRWMDWSLSTVYRDLIFVCFINLIRVPAAERDTQMVADAAKRVGTALGIVEKELDGNKFLCGSDLTVADIAVGGLLYRYYNLEIERPDLPNVAAWYERLCELPAYGEHVMIEFDHLKVEGA